MINLKELAQIRDSIEDMNEIMYQLDALPNRWQLEEARLKRDYYILLYREKTGRHYKSIDELNDAINLGWGQNL